MAKKKATRSAVDKTKANNKRVAVPLVAKKSKQSTPKPRKPGGGRKSKHTPKMDKIAEELAKKGFTDNELAGFFGVTEQTINNWKKQFPLFFESLKTGKALSDSKVKASLFQRAIGYSCPDVHVSSYEGNVTLTPVVKHYPPDTTAQIFWLKNRLPKEFKDKHEIAVSEIPSITVILDDKGE